MLVLAGGVLLAGCANEDRAMRKLNGAGYPRISLSGFAWFRCGLRAYATRFAARDGAGHAVSGVVCSNWLKGDVIERDS